MSSAAERDEQAPHASGAAVLAVAARDEEVDLQPDRAVTAGSVHSRRSADFRELLSPEEFQFVQAHLQGLEDKSREKNRLERWILVAICLNALTISLSFDIEEDWIGWLIIETCFTIIFIFELAYKVYLFGLLTFLRGPDRIWNISDTLLVSVSVMDNILWLISLSTGMGFFAVFRLMRVVRIIRGVRLLRHTILMELSLMLDLIKDGIPTIMWVGMVLILLVFMLGLLMRQTLGRWCVGDEESKESFCEGHLAKYSRDLFSTVPLSCFTVFRCFTEGCASIDGTPLLAHIIRSSWVGMVATCCYCIAYICVVLGIFNIVTGVLVEKTIASAKLSKLVEDEERKQMCRKTSEKFRAYLKGFCNRSGMSEKDRSSVPEEDPPSGTRRPSIIGAATSGIRGLAQVMSADVQDGLDRPAQITRQLFAQIVAQPQAQELLRGMSVMATDGDEIFRLVDVDGLDVVDVDDLVDELPSLLNYLQRPEYLTAELQRRGRRARLRRLSSRTNLDDLLQPLPA